MRRLPPLVVLSGIVSLAGCQCFDPVAEGLDSGVAVMDAGPPGTDAGSNDSGVADAGRLDAGLPDGGPEPTWDGGGLAPECMTAADCMGTPWASLAWCSVDAGLSCIDQRCVSECYLAGRRTCTVSGYCVQCGGEADLCPLDTCPTDAFALTMSAIECRPGFVPSVRAGDSLAFVPIRGASCEFSVSGPSHGLGQATRDGNRRSWFIREFGGWCVGEELPTGAIRSQVACPQCTFVVEGF